jgi:hypothetical protein
MNLEDGLVFSMETTLFSGKTATDAWMVNLLKDIEQQHSLMMRRLGYNVSTQFQSRIQFYCDTVLTQLRDLDLPFRCSWDDCKVTQCTEALQNILKGVEYLSYCHWKDQLVTQWIENGFAKDAASHDAKWAFSQSIGKINKGLCILEQYQLPLSMPFVIIHETSQQDQ